MIKIENVRVYGWEAAIRGMRNPLNSWEKSDTIFEDGNGDFYSITGRINLTERRGFEGCNGGEYLSIGPNDNALMMQLARAGSVHAKYRRMIMVTADVTAPLYWWKEADTHRMGVEKNSCSTMHKIHEKEFTLDDFSFEHVEDLSVEDISGKEIPFCYLFSIARDNLIMTLNYAREMYNKTNDKRYWWQIIQLLPSSYNQRRTVQMNYETLSAMYRDRQNHKLDEWREFCCWVDTLPYSEIITLKEATEKMNHEQNKEPESRQNREKTATEMQNVERHSDICRELNALYAAKNSDYGDSFHMGYKKYGPTMAVIRLEDKLRRFERLTSGSSQNVKGETIRDTLLDLANYAIMAAMEYDDEERKETEK